MGCDIHFVIEKKKGHGWFGLSGTDYGYRPGAKERHYNFFSELAGVRGEGPDAKGVPDDASDLTLECLNHWKGDAHSMTYYSVEHFVEVWLKCNKDLNMLVEDNMYAILDKCLDLGQIADEKNWQKHYRIVIWFDN